jgi:dTDP-4-dehydrorhamnose reductase
MVNAAACTAVDLAESEPAVAYAVNAEAPRPLAEEAKQTGAWLVHYSTDYVFDGNKKSPYDETDQPNPKTYTARPSCMGNATSSIQELHTSFLELRGFMPLTGGTSC